MERFPFDHAEVVAVAEAACGRALRLREVTSRRGAVVWDVTGPEGRVAVKVGSGDGEAAVSREAAVLQELDVPDHLVASGRGTDNSWLVTRWFEGPSTWDAFARFRESGTGRTEGIETAAELCEAVATTLHDRGWVHGDLHPDHGIHTSGGVRLIDLAWTWREGLRPPPVTGVGIDHFVPPELALRGAGDLPLAGGAAADVYTLAATVWTCATGCRPLDYAAAGITPERLTSDQLRARIAAGRIPLRTEEPWPELQSVLRQVLLSGPHDRPSARDLAHSLIRLAS
ncbi:serine/threonine-protein kinase [Nocardiopsis sp. CT-R113]|uniref:Serine/threonine-protein kinase n=1 Tax=Nocardiopsis codii TaxID=3065942 RepID=A0ABU7K5C5_9ACTN|nr:serine/threonine-protein kinase [Nocardiopsis sp. CT-R113]MEE2037453.1 serine/threonine-protein kinase [Nocardiopsis sp. CT-R113]